VCEHLLPRFLPPPGACWQPSDLLPDAAAPDLLEQLAALREGAAQLPPDVLVAVAGAAVAAAGAPNHMSALAAMGGAGPRAADATGAARHGWARCGGGTRGWAGARGSRPAPWDLLQPSRPLLALPAARPPSCTALRPRQARARVGGGGDAPRAAAGAVGLPVRLL
jgi:hypothetical protein